MPDATWQLFVTDAGDMEIVDVLNPPQVAKWTRRRNGYAEMYLEVVDQNDFSELAAYSRSILLMRDGAPVFHGPIVEPFTRNPRLRKITAKDPFFGLSYRRIREKHTETDLSNEIARTLITTQNSYDDTKIVLGDAVSSPTTAKEFQPGEAINEKIVELAKVGTDPWHFHINALGTGTPGKFGEIVFYGITDAPGARFHFGQGTLENCEDYEITEGQVVNRHTSISEKAVAYTEEDSGSIAAYGLWEDERGEVLTEDAEYLDSITTAGLVLEPPKTMTFQCGYDSPKLISDFDMDTFIHIWIKDSGFEYRAKCMVNEVTVTSDPDSAGEIIDAIDVTVVEEE